MQLNELNPIIKPNDTFGTDSVAAAKITVFDYWNRGWRWPLLTVVTENLGLKCRNGGIFGFVGSVPPVYPPKIPSFLFPCGIPNIAVFCEEFKRYSDSVKQTCSCDAFGVEHILIGFHPI
ncbi:hypothetical protein TCAL_16924 [Tigriopus californicus]|uniref:Uncharacterized protein n=1 Tax=Tigriopus californicus TaxID=6832 RepID=A0A553NQQ0_TIGCA|nr:hypothetical protein TCAL_16924 [Tigriopus californicus]